MDTLLEWQNSLSATFILDVLSSRLRITSVAKLCQHDLWSRVAANVATSITWTLDKAITWIALMSCYKSLEYFISGVPFILRE